MRPLPHPAEQSYKTSRITPGSVMDWRSVFERASAQLEDGRLTEALDGYRTVIALKPHLCEAHFNKGLIHLHCKEFQAAIADFGKATELKPQWPEAYNYLGQAYEGVNHLEHAEACYAKAHSMAPEMIPACFNLAQRLKARGCLDEAMQLYERIIAIQPDSIVAINNLGNIYKDRQQYDAAIACYRQILALEPDLAEGHYNLGSALRQTESYQQAIIHLHRAVELRPEYADAWNNLALAFKNIGDLNRALLCFNRAITLNSELAVAHWNRSFVHLLKEDFSAGWIDFEWRFRLPQRATIYPFQISGKRWSGQPVPDATILVHDEQGLGDTLQFMRYLPLVKLRCRKVILETRAELVSLLQGYSGADQVIVRSADGCPDVAYDFYFPLMSLPGLFQTNTKTIPIKSPYIFADRDKIEYWRTKLPHSVLKVGLVWSGRPQHTNDRNRSCRLTDLLPLLQLPGIHYVGLQKGAGSEQAAGLPPGIDFANRGDELHDFSDTAALLANLDLLISVDTAAVHLAGAMGRPVWVMLPFIPDWRWGMAREDCLWYPTLRLFRQTCPKDWAGAIERIRRELLSLARP
jgi:tetratricopeptide (TPR) repeat protein